ncbi:hypothetical protein DFP72DRAFT_942607 [Ephemerocybe angulata]|uniref:Uncharacterized protein n=1 Tax=Ephemerocybe angulata TaxID=980116 RepID=A0A8H6H9C8_9AGAR|nr:hypothetical protein DFP72DRAFT_942607 [Tulosesus angulatus]
MDSCCCETMARRLAIVARRSVIVLFPSSPQGFGEGCVACLGALPCGFGNRVSFAGTAGRSTVSSLSSECCAIDVKHASGVGSAEFAGRSVEYSLASSCNDAGWARVEVLAKGDCCVFQGTRRPDQRRLALGFPVPLLSASCIGLLGGYEL